MRVFSRHKKFSADESLQTPDLLALTSWGADRRLGLGRRLGENLGESWGRARGLVFARGCDVSALGVCKSL